jgi:hypothetical protein
MKTTMNLATRIFATLLLCGPLVVSCDNHDLGPPELEITCDPNDAVSYLNDIKPIVDANCSRCHNSGDFPTRDWTDKELLSEYADEAARRVKLPTTNADHMPQDPPELTLAEITAIVCWAQQGAPTNN